MKCPHCGYVDGYEPSEGKTIDGDEGEFFTFPIPMGRKDEGSYHRAVEPVDLYGCPSCKKTFID
jgi:hypothetical protein